MAAVGGRQEEVEGTAPAGLLELPDLLLHVILSHLTSMGDLGAVAASCSSLRALVRGSNWDQPAALAANVFTPALPGSLVWAAERMPQLRSVDLSGATACSDADLLPLSQLGHLTSLSVAGLWRVTGASSNITTWPPAGDSGRRRSRAGHTQQLDVLGGIVASNRGLVTLDLSGTAVPVGTGLAAVLAQLTAGVPNATKPAHGLRCLRLAGCPRQDGGGPAALREVLLECPALQELDVSNADVTALPVLADSGLLRPLTCCRFSGCELLGGIGWLLSSDGWRLQQLDVSRTAVDDSDVELVGCRELRSLDLSGCCRIKGPGLLALSQAAMLAHLQELRLADLAWVQQQHLGDLLYSWSSVSECGITVDLSGCGGLSDASLQALWPGPTTSDNYCLHQLQLSGSGRVPASALLQLAQVSANNDQLLLSRLQHLDVSHVQSLSRGTSGPGSAAAGPGDSPAAQALSALFEAAGGSLHTAVLDGCFMGAGLLPLLVGCCPGVERLSLVGCSGLANADLAALTGLRCLKDLAVGGSSLAWHENRALSGLTGLTRLRLARRPYLTDAQLAPVLAANRGSLRQLELAGCPSLTDAALLHLLPPAQQGGSSSSEQPAQAGEQVQAAEHGQAGPQQHSVGGVQQQPGPLGEHTGSCPGSPSASRQPSRQRPQSPPLEQLRLVCCDRVVGTSLRHLRRLRSLRLSGCPAVTDTALQAAAICCTRLALLELPSHIAANRMPVAPAGAASHLHGLQLMGGEYRGRRRAGG
ncbi:hypothetical protein COHA_009962 [Chlorella ohadii]|uniref:Uncharacterized protein n=1 Tax=Chlorella ohadii TaxID=2649997 RepID=A0AAD5DDL5_9CHLO|nr:hypothetical protein COHA_009962 [Chlorella ohadii]